MVKMKTNTEKLQERGIRIKYKYINLVTVSAVENGGELPSLHLPPSPSQSRLHLLCSPHQGEFTERLCQGCCRGDLCPLRMDGLDAPKVSCYFQIYRIHDIQRSYLVTKVY